jgi:RNA polymerase sigma factor (sigma-70 family)
MASVQSEDRLWLVDGVVVTEEDILARFGRFIEREALRAHGRYPWAEVDDLIQRGAIGLLAALRSPSRQTDRAFPPFALVSIRNAIRGCPEVARGLDRRLVAQVREAHDSLLLQGCFRPDETAIAAEANRLACQRRRAESLSPADITRGLEMLDFHAGVALEDLVACGREPVSQTRPAWEQSESWFIAFMEALERMLEDCALSEHKVFVARHILFGWPVRDPDAMGKVRVLDGPSVAERLGTSVANIRQLKLRARKAIRARIHAALKAADLHDAEPCLWAVVVLLAAVEEDEDDVGPLALGDFESVLTKAYGVLSNRVLHGLAPRWLCELTALVLWRLRKAGES